ncbi:hypothetical protein J8I87_09335 [Paraburkholderia sp. LEh10]|jgi:hypothetical protein|uniref:hypothetical protein n=1 Tax=Paraburkholderia sp. LEh10 TaxID=2821353 RepID=UPI001AE86218|nr:hypothetical protein [Paraburkholderia sp. LEh10]MBP0589919.1 hypothetical protein [Paraburkholderia sp. LEh10]
MADTRHVKLTAETTGIRLRAVLLSAFPTTARCDAQPMWSMAFRPFEPVRFEYNAALSQCDSRGFPYPFFLDSVRCHA